jgi:hypothetical protein
MADQRGSEKLLDAWRRRSLTEESVKDIAANLDESKGVVEDVQFVGGSSPTGVNLSVAYSGEGLPWCGNDLQYILKWHRKFGGNPRPPIILIDGTPADPDVIRMQMSFGDVRAEALEQLANLGKR